jgi:phosphoserine phosphatase
MNNLHTGAFFDFDKTLIETESAKLGLKYLWEQRLLSSRLLFKILVANFLFQRHLVSDERVARILLKFYRGKRLAEFEDDAPWFYNNYLKPQLAPNILAKVMKHQDSGHVLILISGSIRYMLKPRAKGPLCVNRTKRTLAIELARKQDIDLSNSYAYGNHQSDIPLLELVGNPAVVEPTEPLRKVALKRNWPVLGFK